MGLLETVIEKDYELDGHGRWLKSKEHNSLVIDTEKQVFFWNSRSIVGDVYTWLTQVKRMSYEEAKAYLKTIKEYAGIFIHEIKNTEEYVVYPKLVDVFYENCLINDKSYWYKRGFTDSTIHRFKLGYNDGWYMLPVYQDGLFKNFQMRRDIPEKAIRYYYKNSRRLLFNSDILKIVDTIVITEGPTDCIRLIQEGVASVSHTAGSEGWNWEWFKYFIHQSKIYVVYDNDNAGRMGAKKVATNLGVLRTKIFTFDSYEDKYDVVDFFNDGNNKSHFLDLVEQESKFLFQLV